MVLVEQLLAIKDFAVINQHGINLLVDGLLGGLGVCPRQAGQETNIIIHKRLTSHGELLAIGLQLALWQHLELWQACLELAALRHQLKVTDGTHYIVMVCGGLEVREGAAGSNLLEGSRNLVIHGHDVLLDGLVHDYRERGGRIEELAGQLCKQLSLVHAAKLGLILALAAQALNRQIAEGHTTELVSTSSRLIALNLAAGAHYKAVNGSRPELIALVLVHRYLSRCAVCHQLLHDCRTHGLGGHIAVDVLVSVHAKSATHAVNLANAGTLRSPCLLCGLSSLRICDLSSLFLIRKLALQRINNGLQFLKLLLFTIFQLAACGLGGVNNALLELNQQCQKFLFVHLITSNSFLLISI